MKLIIDSGSTKADWAFVNENVTMLVSGGMNPCFLNKDQIVAIIKTTLTDANAAKEVKEIFFYGAGTSGSEQQQIIRDSFEKVFSNAHVHVEIDTMAAVRATCGNEEGIACIIGTGSNSLYFDGKNSQPNNYGLGYILADEGAGTYLGKKLITHYLYDILPADLKADFEKKYSLTRDEAIQNCYVKPNANAWLASYTKFLFEHKNHSWVIEVVSNGFDEFVHLFVMNYPNYKSTAVHFIGSIAYLFQDILKVVLTANKIKCGMIIQKPIDGLVVFHKRAEALGRSDI
jgi:glucosamine kinase